MSPHPCEFAGTPGHTPPAMPIRLHRSSWSVAQLFCWPSSRGLAVLVALRCGFQAGVTCGRVCADSWRLRQPDCRIQRSRGMHCSGTSDGPAAGVPANDDSCRRHPRVCPGCEHHEVHRLQVRLLRFPVSLLRLNSCSHPWLCRALQSCYMPWCRSLQVRSMCACVNVIESSILWVRSTGVSEDATGRECAGVCRWP